MASNVTDRKIKTESREKSTVPHLHRFVVQFGADQCKYTIDCTKPCTVLEAIRRSDKSKKLNWSDENVIIQLSEKDEEVTVATHFPCSCIEDCESLILKEGKKVDMIKHDRPVQSRDKYSVFYIDTKGGKDTKTKPLFKSDTVKKFKYLCVYGEKGMTVKEALERDGRFIDLGKFVLSDNDKPTYRTEHTQKVDNLDGKKFKICLPREGGKDSLQQEKRDLSSKVPVSDIVKQKGLSVMSVSRDTRLSPDSDEVYASLRQQFPKLKEVMESRWSNDGYQKVLELRKEEFGKLMQSFSEVHRVRELLKQGKSVCKVVVEGHTGTGFVLFDKYILTNAHLFKGCVEGEKLKQGVNVYALFNYEDPEPHIRYPCFQVADSFVCFRQDDLDYAVLELRPQGQTASKKNTKTIPPGLLNTFGPLPVDGQACIIGHPAGELKKMDPTWIIETEDRIKAINDQSDQGQDSLFTVCSIRALINKQGIDNIMSGQRAGEVATYNIFMYHGSSGSPLFDAQCRVAGLHTAGFVYGFPDPTNSVIEFAQPVLKIFEDFVRKLKERGPEEMLKRVEEEAKGNRYLEKVLEIVASVKTEPAEQ